MAELVAQAGSTPNDNLSSEIAAGRREIKTDNFSMTIGEIINLYKDGDLELTPAYQRLFRWEDEQKSRFIESIILGIPLPPIFVAQKGNGKWSIVDGLQRLSTIFQFTGDLTYLDAKGNAVKKDVLTLTTTSKLPSIEGFTWKTINEDVQRLIKRTKFTINVILLSESSIHAQYELFQRLNTGGIHLEDQEIRNCLIIMINEPFYERINKLKEHPAFIKILNLQQNKYDIEYHMELIIRYLINKWNKVNYNNYKISSNLLREFIDKEMLNFLNDPEFDLDKEEALFIEAIDLLDTKMGLNAFQKYYPNKGNGVFEGGFSNSVYESILAGFAANIGKYRDMPPADFVEKIKAMYIHPDFIKYVARGNKAIYRIKGLNEFSHAYFK